MKKKKGLGIVGFLAGIGLLLLGISDILSAFGGTSVGESKTPVNQEPLTKAEIRQMYTDPSEFRGRPIEISGQILDTPEYGASKITFQIYADPENWEMNTYIEYKGTDLEIKKGDYVKISGTVNGKVTGTNLLGGKLSAPKIAAESVELSTYKDVVSPTLRALTPNEPTQTQNGYSVTIDSIEIAEKETRVYIKVENQGKADFSIYSYSSKLIQDGKQYDPTYNFNADYPEVQSGIAPGVTTEGVYCFDHIENASFTIILEGHSNNYREDFDPFKFEITVE